MGDRRFNAPFERLARSRNLPAEIRAAPDEDLIAALAAASAHKQEPYFTNVLATELQNRLHRKNGVLNTAGDALVTLDAASRVTYLNPAAERMTGFALEEARDNELHAVLTCLDHAEDEPCPIVEVARGGPALRSASVRMRRRDGAELYALATVEQLLREGIHEGAVLALHDITEHRRAERELEAHRQLLESLHRALDELGEGITVTEGGRIVYANDAFLRLTGYDREELLAIEPLDLASPEDRDRIHRETTSQLSGEAPPAPLDILLRRKDGSVIRAEIATRLVSDGQGARVVTVIRDVTSRRNAEDRLRKSEARWRALVERIPGYIVTVDRSGAITYVSRGALGARASEFVGKSIFSFIAEEDVPAARRAIDEVFETGEPREYEARGRSRTGALQWHHARVAPLDPDGEDDPGEALVLSLAMPPPEGRLPQRS